MKDTRTITHLLDYPPRGTACGLYYPERLYEEGFGTYFDNEITCKKCQLIKEYEKRQRAVI